MTLVIILVVLFVLGLFLLRNNNDDVATFGFVLTFIMGLFIIMHIGLIATASFDYQRARVKRTSVVNTIKEARINNAPIERAAITKDIINFNQYLASKQYYNTIPFLDPYIDDRFNNLQPIR